MTISVTRLLSTTLAAAVLASSLGAAPAEARNGRKAAIAAGVLGALAIGALAAGAAGGYERDCWVERRPVYDYWGNVVRYRGVRVCN